MKSVTYPLGLFVTHPPDRTVARAVHEVVLMTIRVPLRYEAKTMTELWRRYVARRRVRHSQPHEATIGTPRHLAALIRAKPPESIQLNLLELDGPWTWVGQDRVEGPEAVEPKELVVDTLFFNVLVDYYGRKRLVRDTAQIKTVLEELVAWTCLAHK